MHVMPIAMSATFAFFPAGLVLYWVTNTVLSILQQWNINRRIEERAPREALSATRRAVAADTIVAAATPPGRGGIAIVRVSGRRCARCPDRGAACCGALPRAARRHEVRSSATQPARRSIMGSRSISPRRIPTPASTCSSCTAHGGPVLVETLIRRVARARRAARAARRVHAARLPERQARPGAGRGGREPDRCGLRGGGARGAALARGRVLASRAARSAGARRAARLRSRRRSISPRSRSIAVRSCARGAPLRRSDSAAGAALASRRRAAAHRGHERRDHRPPERRQVDAAESTRGHEAAIVTALPAPRAMCCASASCSMACRCRSWTPPACAPPACAGSDRGRGHPPRRAAMARADRILFVIDAVDDPEARPTPPSARGCRRGCR